MPEPILGLILELSWFSFSAFYEGFSMDRGLLRVTFLTRKKKMLVVDVYTVNTTKGRTKQVLNTTGMRQKKMLVIRIGQIDG